MLCFRYWCYIVVFELFFAALVIASLLIHNGTDSLESIPTTFCSQMIALPSFFMSQGVILSQKWPDAAVDTRLT